MEKRLILAIVLSTIIIFTFQRFTYQEKAKLAQNTAAKAQQREAVVETKAVSLEKKEAVVNEIEYFFDTKKFTIIFSNIGGSIREIRLKDFKNSAENKPYVLASSLDPEQYILSIDSPGIQKPLNLIPYNVSQHPDSISFTAIAGDIEIIKTYNIGDHPRTITLDLTIINRSGGDKKFFYNIIGGSGVTEDHASDKRFVEVTGKIDGKMFNFQRPGGKKIINHGIIGWTTMKNKYFTLILKPFGNAVSQFYYGLSDGTLIGGITSGDIVLGSNASLTEKFILYAGPSQQDILKDVGYDFQDSINLGPFGFIAKGIFVVLKFLKSIVHSWGISIILVTVVLNVIMLPLTMAGFKSMKRMQELAPQIERVKERCKDNKEKMNQEIMALYKTQGVSPLGGCLPYLLQIPVFIALYDTLMRTIELRGEKFLWIRDLSLPEQIPIPFNMPLIGDSINLLPIIMAGMMFVQQKISPMATSMARSDEQKQQQKMMSILMPILFCFMFYNMPSGLVLYWFCNTLLMTAEQYYIFKNI